MTLAKNQGIHICTVTMLLLLLANKSYCIVTTLYPFQQPVSKMYLRTVDSHCGMMTDEDIILSIFIPSLLLLNCAVQPVKDCINSWHRQTAGTQARHVSLAQ